MGCEDGLKASKDKISASLLQSVLAQKLKNKEDQDAILIQLGLMNEETKELFIEKACTQEKLEGTLAQKLKNKTDERGILSALGLTGANEGLTVSFKLLGQATKNAWAQMLAFIATPMGQAMLAVGAVTALAVAFEAAHQSSKELNEQLETKREELSSLTNQLEETESELEETTTRYDRLIAKQKQSNLTVEESKELENLKNITEELLLQKGVLEENIELKKQNVASLAAQYLL